MVECITHSSIIIIILNIFNFTNRLQQSTPNLISYWCWLLLWEWNRWWYNWFVLIYDKMLAQLFSEDAMDGFGFQIVNLIRFSRRCRLRISCDWVNSCCLTLTTVCSTSCCGARWFDWFQNAIHFFGYSGQTELELFLKLDFSQFYQNFCWNKYLWFQVFWNEEKILK